MSPRLSLVLSLLLLPAVLSAQSVCEAVSSTNITNDAAPDLEPVAIARNRQATGASVTAYMKFVGANPTLFTKSEATGMTTQLPLPPYADISGDPAVAFGLGSYANRIYVAGATYRNSCINPQPCPTQVSLWYSNNDGNTWTGPTAAGPAEDRTSGGALYDKPAITVSAASGTLGHVYVAALRFGGQTSIAVSRSSNGGVTFDATTYIPVAPLAHSPQIFVDFFGYVWVAWIEHGTLTEAPDAAGNVPASAHGKIHIAQSTDNGATFVESSAGPLDAGLLLGPDQTVCTAYGRGGDCLTSTLVHLDRIYKSPSDHDADYIQARSMLAGKFHAGNYWGGIALVWHARESDNIYAPTDVKLVRVSTYGRYPGWDSLSTIGHVTTRDQWNPAVDYEDSFGQGWMVSYYDRRLDTTNALRYRVFMTRLGIDFGNLEPCDRPLTNVDATGTSTLRLGEYQGLFYSGGIATAVFTYVNNVNNQPQSDIHRVSVPVQ